MGHLTVEIAILFNEIDARFSDGALVAIERAKAQMFQPDWKKVFEPESVDACIEQILK